MSFIVPMVVAGAALISQAPHSSFTVENLCSSVDSQTLELEPFHESIVYQYQTMLYQQSGVIQSDDENTVKHKVRDFINSNMPRLLCARINFYPTNSNLLKLAVARQSQPFLDDALRVWKVDLNQIDNVDGATVLDYIIRKKAEAGSNRVLNQVYDNYYARFRAAGALTADEVRAAH
ncbi:hypothetical protein [Phenylobacterium sp.]|uniref:hypothetical protein n=1 Tax=Phenylobacterium sp. TaxID=1871053 RepID=UPI0035AEEA38